MESTCVITYGLGAIAAGQTPHVTWLVMLPLSSARVARFFFEGGRVSSFVFGYSRNVYFLLTMLFFLGRRLY